MNKLITFWSPVSGVGVSLTALNVAKMMAKKGLRVALLDFDLKSPSLHLYLRTDDSVHCLDNVIPFTAGGQLNERVLESNLQEIDGVFLLRGTNSPEQAQYIKIDALTAILEAAKSMFDFVIVDSQSIVDNAGSFVALDLADKVFLVTEKNVVTIQCYEQAKNVLLQNFQLDRFQLLLNKTSKAVYMERAEVELFYSMSCVGELPLLDVGFINAINQGRWGEYLMDSNKAAKPYLASLEKLIVEAIDPEFLTRQKAKGGLKLFGKK